MLSANNNQNHCSALQSSRDNSHANPGCAGLADITNRSSLCIVAESTVDDNAVAHINRGNPMCGGATNTASTVIIRELILLNPGGDGGDDVLPD
jgi:hypothetical protein